VPVTVIRNRKSLKTKSPFFLRTGFDFNQSFGYPHPGCPTISEMQRDYNNQAFFVPGGFGYKFLI
jgi:hypothetical protein